MHAANSPMGNSEIKDTLRYAEEGNVSMIKKMVRDSSAVHVADETGNTALHCAVFQGHFEVASATRLWCRAAQLRSWLNARLSSQEF